MNPNARYAIAGGIGLAALGALAYAFKKPAATTPAAGGAAGSGGKGGSGGAPGAPGAGGGAPGGAGAGPGTWTGKLIPGSGPYEAHTASFQPSGCKYGYKQALPGPVYICGGAGTGEQVINPAVECDSGHGVQVPGIPLSICTG
jgi:hypothetical protein